jgi:hypothetical protein
MHLMNQKTRFQARPKPARTRARRRNPMAHGAYEELDDVDIPEAALGPAKTMPSAS